MKGVTGSVQYPKPLEVEALYTLAGDNLDLAPVQLGRVDEATRVVAHGLNDHWLVVRDGQVEFHYLTERTHYTWTHVELG